MSMTERSEKHIRFSSFVFYCADLPKALEECTALGYTFTKEKHGDGPVHYSTEIGHGFVELYPGNKPIRIGMQVDSVDEWVNDLAENGVATSPIKDSKYGRFTTIKDTEGRVLELREPPKRL